MRVMLIRAGRLRAFDGVEADLETSGMLAYMNNAL